MGSIGEDDPYSWDINVVVQRLCVLGWAWSGDIDSLATRIREEEIDGKTLLTFEHVCSRQELMDCLHIKKARHKAAFAEVIVTLRSKSKGYWLWEQDFKRKRSSYWDEQVEERTICTKDRADSSNLPSGGHQKQGETSTLASASNATLHSADERITQEHASTNQMSGLQKDSQPNSVGNSNPPLIHERPTQGTESDERSTKRRRMAPTLLEEKPLNIAGAFLPTEADVLTYAAANANLVSEKAFPWEDAPAYAYLGDGKVSPEAIISPDNALTSLVREHKDSFDSISLRRIPPARRLVVNKALRRLFTGRYRIPQHSSSSPSVLYDPDDEILELAELGGVGDETDDKTWDEVEKEESEYKNALHNGGESNALVTPERIAEVLNEAIDAVEAKWREKKLPKYERKAHGIWQKSRRHGTKNLQIQRAHELAKHLINRIQKLCHEIQKQDWTSESSYRDAAKSLEQSLEDKLYQTWLIKMLESSKPPPKPQGAHRPKPTTERQLNELLDDEVLTSSDEDDFVVPDSHTGLVEEGLGRDQRSPIRTMKEEPMDAETTFVDLTQDDLDDLDDRDGCDMTNPIDLTSPAKDTNMCFVEETQNEAPETHTSETALPESTVPGGDVSGTSPPETQAPAGPIMESRDLDKQLDELPLETSLCPRSLTNLEPPPIENFGDLQKLASESLNKLAKNSDRWRLLIGEMWQMEHERRKAAVNLILSEEPGAVWSKHIVPYLDALVRGKQGSNEEGSKGVLFDVIRLCHCFFMCQHKTEEHMSSMKPAKIKKHLVRQQSRLNMFEPFYMFIKLLVPHFPQDSQIYKQETYVLGDHFPEEEDDLDILDDLSDIDAEADRDRQRPRPKEIIRDKAAVDLREREKQRIEEQELRRSKLRTALASQPLAAGDGNRIIINESKEEDQGLIYVNDHIARSIKQHQVDGVRFIWNQIVRDASVRQGCLLAHTMGLGKTMQVITVLVALAEASESQDPSVVAQIPKDLQNSRTLVLCPAVLVDNWMDEFLKWAPANALGALRKCTANTPEHERPSIVTSWASGKGVLILSYNMFQILIEMSPELSNLLRDRPDVVVCDEAHYMKNRDSKTNKACSRFQTKSRIALTGSPLSNKLLEYFAMIDWVAPNFLGPYSEFREIYSAPVKQGLFHDSTTAERREAQMLLKALEQMVAPKVHRRNIVVMKGDLPPKQEFIIFVPPTEPQKKLYRLYMEGVSRDGGGTPDTLAAIPHLGLICSHPKCFQAKILEIIQNKIMSKVGEETDKSFPKTIIPEFTETLESFGDLDSPAISWKTELLTTVLNEAREVNDKVLVFSQSLITLDYLEDMCKNQGRTVSRMDGKTPVAVRQQQVKDFNQGSKEVFLISTAAGGVGLNIHGANRVVIFDIRHNPSHEQQAVGRAYRIGQQKKVFVYRFMVAGTFEDNLNNRQVFKMQLASRVVDKKNPISWSKRKGDVVAEIRDRPAADLVPYLGKDPILDKLIKLRENGEAIRSIVSTDTFEEEDLNATLTEEENKAVTKMIELNRLRVSNPEEYARRARSGMYLTEQARLRREQELPLHPTQAQPAHQSFDGAMDMPGDAQFLPASSTATRHQWDLPSINRPPALLNQGSAPMPMTGANTFFRGQYQTETPSTQQPVPNATFRELTQPLPSPNPSAGSTRIAQITNVSSNNPPNRESRSTQSPALLSHPSPIFKQNRMFNVRAEIPARTKFENRLRESIGNLQKCDLWPMRDYTFEDARALTTRIDRIREEGRYGLLPDMQQWNMLNEFISRQKFVIAIISGYISPEYVAQATAEDLEKRFEAIGGFNEAEIFAKAREKAKDPDPINLQNIGRHNSHQDEERSKATNDMKVMREAMDNRRSRAVRLPTWANEALENAQKYRASPVVDTLKKQSISKSGTPHGA
ncbi:unnamed protein product [Fusarium graminearum]|uniref:Chromosome 4, complete genome n=1 Tax=Gibberella zeae (strain ATCC MYA-4620 / CBS 123657 / FGSC 9075 / NRRL 31084 / PH-1) TaxID=229533 RepID=A0A1C3YL18_GIBZE|nr:unnamed protein product [Fusarium graminearum]